MAPRLRFSFSQTVGLRWMMLPSSRNVDLSDEPHTRYLAPRRRAIVDDARERGGEQGRGRRR